MGQPLNGREAVSVGHSGDEPSVSVTGVGVPNVLLTAVGELERGDVLGSRYQIEAVIGTGGSGRVLRAFDRESRMPVALKILRPEFASDPVWTERFSRELRIGRTITHPNVCRVFDIGDADGHKFLSMELASRGSIRADVPKLGSARVTPTRPLRSWAERVADAQAVVDGVAALHTAGIVHRDLKPENILRMGDGRLVVTDFGLATDPDAHGNTVMVGTPSYMAPEVVMGDPATKRSDVWGLGVVLHEILFGCRPQWKPAGRGYRRFVLPDEVATPVQRATAELCGRCADDTADVRPPSAAEVRDELARALRGKRRLSRARTRQIAWGVVAVAAFGALAVVRERWSNRAEASLSGAAAPVAERVLTPTGTPEDWSKGATRIASFSGPLHCYSLLDRGRRVRAIWGTPRRAEDIELATGRRSPSELVPEAYRDGCPSLSPDGTKLLYTRTTEQGNHVYLSPVPTGRFGKEIVRGSLANWLPNGKEFVFGFDASNAGLFSLPTGEMVLVRDSARVSKQLIDLAVDPKGEQLSALYIDDRGQKLFVAYELPSLNAASPIVLPPTARGMRFDASGPSFVARKGADYTLVALDARNGRARNVATSPGREILSLMDSGHGETVIARRSSQDDLWLRGADANQRLTSDGISVAGAMSSSGLILSQKRLPEGGFAIFLRAANGDETQVTRGPIDVTPTFYPNGAKWAYASISSKQIVTCDEGASPKCTAAYADDLGPGFPSVDPTGHRLAYVTFNSPSRLRIGSLDDGALVRDLGPAAGVCSPIWVNEDRLWFVQTASDSHMTWSEISSKTGGTTGRTEKVHVENQNDCRLPPALGSSSGRGHQVVSLTQEASDLLVTLRPAN